MQGIYKIAGHTFRIETRCGILHERCAPYKTEEPAEFSVTVTPEDIAKEKTGVAGAREGENLSESAYESIAVYRKITDILADFDFLLFHGSAVSVDGSAYMFVAKSGTGKSTHTRMWRELLGQRAVMVNDDKPLVHISEEGVLVYGTPWNGKHHLGNNIAVPLKGICVLRRGEENSIREIGLAEAYPMLLQQIHRGSDGDHARKAMELIDRMESNVRFYTMKCNISTEAAGMAFHTMHKGEKKNEVEG